MTLNKLASEIAKREGKKSQARIGDIREILKIIVEMDAEMSVNFKMKNGPIEALIQAAFKRATALFKAESRK